MPSSGPATASTGVPHPGPASRRFPSHVAAGRPHIPGTAHAPPPRAARLRRPLASPSTALAAQTPDSSLVTLERVFASDEFAPEFLGQVRWLAAGGRRTPSSSPTARAAGRGRAGALRRRHAAAATSGARRPPGPAGRHGAARDRGLHLVARRKRRLLIFTNSEEGLAAEHPRRLLGARLGDAGALRKLGGDAQAVDADVREVLARRRPRRPTSARTTLRRGPRRRPRSRSSRATARARSSTAPSTGCTRRSSTCATGSAGAPTAGGSPTGSSTRPACATSPDQRHRLALLRSSAGPVSEGRHHQLRRARRRRERRPAARRVWLDVPGDPRNNYIARMDWAASSGRGRAPAAEPAAEHATT